VRADTAWSYIGSPVPLTTTLAREQHRPVPEPPPPLGAVRLQGRLLRPEHDRAVPLHEPAGVEGPLEPERVAVRQARCVAARSGTPTTFAGYYEKANFVRFRELSATFSVRSACCARSRAENASLSLGARNLAVWTKFTGEDPEANFNAGTATGLGGNVQNNIAAPRPGRTTRPG
jgi:hypothetical protein